MKKAYMTYYEHLAKLSTIANKQTLFFSHLLHRMEYDNTIKQLVVELTPRVKRQILTDLGIKSKDPLNLAKGYLTALTKAELIKSIGKGSYVIDPASYGYSAYVSKELRARSKNIFEKIKFNADNKPIKEIWVELNTGEIIQVGEDGLTEVENESSPL